MSHFLKLNSQMTGSSKMLTQLQVSEPISLYPNVFRFDGILSVVWRDVMAVSIDHLNRMENSIGPIERVKLRIQYKFARW